MEASTQIVARLSEEQIKKVKYKQKPDVEGLIKLLRPIPKKDLLKLRRVNLLFNLAVLMIFNWQDIVLNNIREFRELKVNDAFNIFKLTEEQLNELSSQQTEYRYLRNIEDNAVNRNLSYYVYFKEHFKNITELEKKLGLIKSKSYLASLPSLFAKIISYDAVKDEEVKVYLDALVFAARQGYSNILSRFGVDNFTKLFYSIKDRDFLFYNYFNFKGSNINSNILLAATQSGNPVCLIHICSCLNIYFKDNRSEFFNDCIIQAYQYALNHSLTDMIEIFLKNYPSLFKISDFLSFLEQEESQGLAELMIDTALVYLNKRNIFSETLNYVVQHDKEKGAIFLLDNFVDGVDYYDLLTFSIKNAKSKIRDAFFKHPKCLELSDEQKTNLLAFSIEIKDIISLRFLLARCKCNLDAVHQQKTLIELAVTSSTPNILIQLIVSGASYDLAKLLCLLAQNPDQDQALSNDTYAKALHLIQYRGELLTKSQNNEKSALCEAVKYNNLTLINLFTSFKGKHNKISLEEATLALDLAKEYAKDMFSPNINRYNLMVIKLTEFVKRLQFKLQLSPLLPPEKQTASVNIAPYASFHQPKSDDRQILQKPAAATLDFVPHHPQP